ncbi:hypothetical protein Gasu2_04280 [Galdieria sulphuraria]|nr:hypothetical protein Gasu2_04280 [Galdieria sulphuraria]
MVRDDEKMAIMIEFHSQVDDDRTKSAPFQRKIFFSRDSKRVKKRIATRPNNHRKYAVLVCCSPLVNNIYHIEQHFHTVVIDCSLLLLDSQVKDDMG